MQWINEIRQLLAHSIKTHVKGVAIAANGGQISIGTASLGNIEIESIILKSNGVITSDFTDAVISSGPSGSPTVVTLITSKIAKLSNLSVDGEQVAWTGAVRLEPTDLIVINLSGTGATAVDFTATVKYRATDLNGGILS